MPACEKKSVIHTLVQITDSHLFAGPEQVLLGLPTSASLKAVVEQVCYEQPVVDLILATGDITQDASVAAYQQFVEQVAVIGAPMRWLPGNHDDALVQQAASEMQGCSEPVTDLPGWRIILLNSAVSGAVHGYLEAAQLELLEQALQQAGSRHVLVCLHHHPVSVGSAWLDKIGLDNADALFAVIDRYPAVKGILWGHIHQEFDQRRNGVRLLATPSTCIQFACDSQDFALDSQLPGYRWLRLHENGEIETGVSRLQQLGYEIDHTTDGY